MARKRRRGTSLIEAFVAVAFLAVLVVPLMGALGTTARGVGLTQEHLVAQQICQGLYEHVAYVCEMDDAAAFEAAVGPLEVAAGEVSPLTGCKGRPVASLSAVRDGIVMPCDGDERFRVDGDDPTFAGMFAKFSYSLAVTRLRGRPRGRRRPGVAMYRIDIVVSWKGNDGMVRECPYANFVARRRYLPEGRRARRVSPPGSAADRVLVLAGRS